MSTKYCETLSQNSPRRRLSSRFFIVKKMLLLLYLRPFKNFMSANHKKIRAKKRKSANCHICGRFANLTNNLHLQNLRIS
jgi:hypothetical protein